MGSLVKSHLSSKFGVEAKKIFHVTLMPCFDKKLEASRENFKDDEASDVDMVITAVELEQMLSQSDKSLTMFSPQKLDSLFPPMMSLTATSPPPTLPPLLTNFGSGSGGFAENVFIASAKELFGQDIASPINFKIVKNSDFQEIALGLDGEIKLKFCIVNGFRNIQNIVQVPFYSTYCSFWLSL